MSHGSVKPRTYLALVALTVPERSSLRPVPSRFDCEMEAVPISLSTEEYPAPTDTAPVGLSLTFTSSFILSGPEPCA